MDGHSVIAPAGNSIPISPDTTTDQSLTGQHPAKVVQQVPAVRRVPDTQPTETAGACSLKKNSGVHNPGSLDPLRFVNDIDLSDPQLPINIDSPDYVPLDRLVPPPPSSPALQQDSWMTWLSGKPGEFEAPDYVAGASPEEYFSTQMRTRQQVEEAGGRFAFKPFMITLVNMQRLIHHIQAGRQFPAPLTEAEAAALERLEAQTTALVQAGTPWYKDSVCLALSLMTVCELITNRQVLHPLRQAQPQHSRRILMYLHDCAADRNDLLAVLPWTPSPDAPKASAYIERLFREQLRGSLAAAFLETIHDRDTWLYPSFHPLTLDSFCRFCHLPLYPVGLTADYAAAADGVMRSPLYFADHDLQHMRTLQHKGRPEQGIAVETVLDSRERRLQLRQMLLDQTPQHLTDPQLGRALILLLFHLIHEDSPAGIALGIARSCSPFCFFLEKLTRALRELQDYYSATDRGYTERKAALAALWTASLWVRWKEAGYLLTPEQLQHHAQTFVRKEAPLLQQHLDFIAEHRGTLRPLFIKSWLKPCDDDIKDGCFLADMKPQQHFLTLFQRDYGQMLRHLDNTDLAWFWAIERPEMRQKIQEVTRSPVPDSIGRMAIQ